MVTVLPSGMTVGIPLNVTKPGHCRMITRFASHIIVSAIRLIIMSPPSVNAVAVSRLLDDVIAASVMPSVVALLALHAAVVTTRVSVVRIRSFQSARARASDWLMFIAV